MSAGITAAGSWELCLDPAPCRYNTPPDTYPMTMQLPGTTAQQEIGGYSDLRTVGRLSEKYPFEGQIWLRRTFSLTPEQIGKPCTLFLERTRMTKLWVNGVWAGSENSLCTPHIYDLTDYSAPKMELVLCISNTGYPTRGGHMTSPDTQTNWIGVIGKIMLEIHTAVYLSDLQVRPELSSHTATVDGILHGTQDADAEIILTEDNVGKRYVSWTLMLRANAEGRFSVTLPLPDDIPYWDEYHPNCFGLVFAVKGAEHAYVSFGVREFSANGDHFEINTIPVMLRGKHDAMLFPLDGAPPTDIEDWIVLFRTAKEWGINHYRFHTCCPPEAAFAAADEIGIYLEPELPFWGTLHAPGETGYDAAEQDYLLREGLRICRTFGNHPSFCMLSLGNELWGSKERMGYMIETMRAADHRMLYTQGSNNFQHMPQQLPQEDFWTGVRTGAGRLLRGSFASCDAPEGKIQSEAPSTSWDYQNWLVPPENAPQDNHFYPTVPVVSHEIGQYSMFPDFSEIPEYTGVTEARNLMLYQERLEAAGMGDQAEAFFACSGALARESYKAELEAAMRSPQLAGFQILDLQDYPGQGTSTVGMLNAFMENKGLIEPKDWRGFCGDLVPLAKFDSFIIESGKTFRAALAIRNSRQQLVKQNLNISLTVGTTSFHGEIAVPESQPGYIRLGTVGFAMPENAVGKARLTLTFSKDKISNNWELTALPPVKPLPEKPDFFIAHSFTEAEPYLQGGRRVLLLPDQITHAIDAEYCTTFWNYPMFKSIAESLGKEPPVGTLGLCIQEHHPIAESVFSKSYTTPQWYQPLKHAKCAVLDEAPEGYRPIVQMIDNPERCHRLGLLFEANVSGGKLLVCTVRLDEAPEDLSINRLAHAIYTYMQSKAFAPEAHLSADLLRRLCK